MSRFPEERRCEPSRAAPAPGGGGALAPVEVSALHRPTGRTGLGLALTLTTVAMWSTLPLGLEVALEYFDPLTLVWSRFLVAAAVLGTVLRVRSELPRLSRLRGSGWVLLATAVAFLACNYLCYILGLDYTNASTAQVVIQLAPLLLGIGAILIYKERFRPAQWLGLGAILAGLLIFAGDQLTRLLGEAATYYAGLGFMLAAAVTWAVYGLAQKQLLVTLGSGGVMLVIYTSCALVFLPVADPSVFGMLDARGWIAFTFCAFNTLAAYGCFAEALVHWEASRVSAVLAVVPLVTLAVLSAAETFAPGVLEPEPITAASLGGAALVVAGSITSALSR